MEFIHHINEYISGLLIQAPYFWIFIFMTLESTLVPLPAEIVMPPAGYFAYQGHINIWIAILMGVLGSICGSLICYAIALFGGENLSRKLLGEKYHNMGIRFFEKNGNLAVFFGRLLPVVRHIIGFPAGIFEMNIKNFIIYTALGSTIRVGFLTYIGYIAGQNAELVHKYKTLFVIGIVIVFALIVGLKIWIVKKFSK